MSYTRENEKRTAKDADPLLDVLTSCWKLTLATTTPRVVSNSVRRDTGENFATAQIPNSVAA